MHMDIGFFSKSTLHILRSPAIRKAELTKSDKIFLIKHYNVYACKISPVADFFHRVGIWIFFA